MGYGKSPLEYLRENNNFVTTNNKGEEVVSVACILLFCKNPQKFFPRGRTRFIRYEGIDEKVGAEMNVIKDVSFEGTILNQVRKTVEYLETQVREHTFLGQHGQFVTLRDYPEFVIQEMRVQFVIERIISRGLKSKSRCSMTILCSNRLASCQGKSSLRTYGYPFLSQSEDCRIPQGVSLRKGIW